jgi:glycosyltransferase involved in cell wall biosynthesis
MIMDKENIKLRILIAVATYNRPRITELSLATLCEMTGEDDTLVVYDDGSTAYDASSLKYYADEVVRMPVNGGIERLRAQNFRDFVERYREYDLLYLTDNDTVHDPAFSTTLRQLYMSAKLADGRGLPVCLYRSAYHEQPHNIQQRKEAISIRTTAPGISQLYDREMAETILRGLNEHPQYETMYGYDFHLPKMLQRPFVQSEVSFVEHFARDTYERGLHGPNSGVGNNALADFERDRAMNPTPFLKMIRPVAIDYILQRAGVAALRSCGLQFSGDLRECQKG